MNFAPSRPRTTASPYSGRWFEPIGAGATDPGEGAAPTLRLLRRPGRAYDTRAEVWLDASLHYLPLRVRLSNGGETLELAWRGAAPTP